MVTAGEYANEALLLSKLTHNGGVFRRQYDFERNLVDTPSWHIHMKHYWHYSIYTSVVYIILIFSIQRYMRDRPKFHLRGPLVAWNLVLAIFSMWGSVRTSLDLFIIIKEDGFYASVCDSKYFTPSAGSAISFWGVLFVLSKYPELIDTFFIVLRKQKLIFLHWYHHATVLVYCCLCHSEYAAPAYWFLTMNFTVHAFMYLYYAIRATGYRVPLKVNIVITSLQITQMVVGCGVLIYAYAMKTKGYGCDVSDFNLTYGGLMYLSYFILFANFFYHTYFGKGTYSIKQALKKRE
uniref:Elongation of very long chain fatty acids protein n=1 Tax=Saccoglossus kowalevskii TaxID=10224 RepID=A0ABM0GZB5_SACKO|nr:PREDICTED: elongation of very long chain fatty acids protein 6-like [Saccoglossus kowalevskii]